MDHDGNDNNDGRTLMEGAMSRCEIRCEVQKSGFGLPCTN